MLSSKGSDALANLTTSAGKYKDQAASDLSDAKDSAKDTYSSAKDSAKESYDATKASA